jgi:hypothetical protein
MLVSAATMETRTSYRGKLWSPTKYVRVSLYRAVNKAPSNDVPTMYTRTMARSSGDKS